MRRLMRLGQDLPDGPGLHPGPARGGGARHHPRQRDARPATSARSSIAATRALGVNPFPCPVDSAILLWEWGAYLGDDALENGVDVKVSSWSRAAPNTFPSLAKTSANYANSQLIKMEAIVDGYSEGIALDSFGYRQRRQRPEPLHRPRRRCSTRRRWRRRSCRASRATRSSRSRASSGYRVREEMLPREMLYIADEAVLRRHGGRDHADPVGRQDRRRQRASAARSPRRSSARSSTSSTAWRRTPTAG